jgi:hypothetical protein
VRTHLFRAGLAALGAVVVLGGLIAAGRKARAELARAEQFTVPFEAVAFNAPPGMSEADFRDEVRYIARPAERVSLADPALSKQIAGAFARHPWVERVEGVRVERGRSVRVELRFRTPFLAVPHASGCDGPRYVDRRGILLPAGSAAEDVPALTNIVPRPAVPSGQVWDDPVVTAAVRLAEQLAPHQGRLRLTSFTHTPDGWVLGHATGTTLVRWGRIPGDEGPAEPTAHDKLEGLLAHCDRHGGLDRPADLAEHDVRSPGQFRVGLNAPPPAPPLPAATTFRRLPAGQVVPRGEQSPHSPEPFRVAIHPAG